jgi:hypothetical protein
MLQLNRQVFRTFFYLTADGQLFLVNDQRDAQFFPMYLFLFLTLYMFRAHRAHHQERPVLSIQPLVAVTLCRWPCRVQVGSSLPTCTRHGHRHRVTATRGYIDTTGLSWWWARCARNMYRVKNKNKYIGKKCASRWSFTKNHYMMHDQQNIKKWRWSSAETCCNE